MALLVDLYDRALREPLPIACKTSAVYADAERRGLDKVAVARDAWEGGFQYAGESGDPEHVLVLGAGRPFADVGAAAARPDERWHTTEPTRFGRYALRLWSDLLDVEELSHL